MSDYNEGDMVEAAKGETVIRGRLENAPQGGSVPILKLSLVLGSDIAHLKANGYTVTVIERAKPALPTEPWRCYIDKYGAERGYGNIWFTDGAGRMHSWPEGSNPEKYAPFIRLESPAETAKKVLNQVRLCAINRTSDTLTIRDLVMENIAAEFGVTGGLGE